MKILIVLLIVIAAVSAILYLTLKRKKDNKSSSEINQVSHTQGESMVSLENNALDIQMEMLPAETIDESALVEIKDYEVLSRIDSVIPGLAATGLKIANAAKFAKIPEKHSETLYRVVIPKGVKLAKSRSMKDAFRGMYHGAKGIKGQANLVKVKTEEIKTAGIRAANVGASVMQIASMVVGQYYMSQINSKLEEVSEGINRIESFQDNEFRSKVFALVVEVKEKTEFNSEIIENEEMIKSEYIHLKALEHECIELLGQANLTIADFAKKKELDFNAYKEEVQRAQTWYEYQQTLLEVLYIIADLKYTLQLGKVSRKRCGSFLSTYTKQVSKTNSKLIGWHESTANRLEVDISEMKRRRTGFDRAIHWVPGRFVKDQNYRTLEKSTADMIETQITGKTNAVSQDKSDLYNEDVQIISKEGKLYYLPSNEA